mmetsp:Transcript_3155/g.14084  ORF Transcript_3155/g.14084 Transcript_3155/m.14084 type:complete len:209 (-) Transcript_3155:725-1351(-)
MSSWILLTSVAALVTLAAGTGEGDGGDEGGVAGCLRGRPGPCFVGEGVAGTCASPPGVESPGGGRFLGRPGPRFGVVVGVVVVVFFSATAAAAFGSRAQPAQNQSPAGTPRRPRQSKWPPRGHPSQRTKSPGRSTRAHDRQGSSSKASDWWTCSPSADVSSPDSRTPAPSDSVGVAGAKSFNSHAPHANDVLRSSSCSGVAPVAPCTR